MSREIKFRGWDCVGKQMLPVENIDFRNKYISLNEDDNSLTDTFEMIELMQYTGFKDKENTEIYEGDILKYQWTNPLTKDEVIKKYLVVFKDGEFQLQNIPNSPYGDQWLKIRYKELIVIGNRFSKNNSQ